MTAIRGALAVASAILGVLLGSLCVAACGTEDCDCLPYEPIVEGTFDVTSVASPNNPAPPDLSGATVTVSTNGVNVEYTRGSARITAIYAVERKSP